MKTKTHTNNHIPASQPQQTHHITKIIQRNRENPRIYHQSIRGEVVWEFPVSRPSVEKHLSLTCSRSFAWPARTHERNESDFLCRETDKADALPLTFETKDKASITSTLTTLINCFPAKSASSSSRTVEKIWTPCDYRPSSALPPSFHGPSFLGSVGIRWILEIGFRDKFWGKKN